MREFFDKATGLSWVVPEVEMIGAFGSPVFFPNDNRVLSEFAKELNQYGSENINLYVTGGDVPLGDFTTWVLDNNDLPYYAFDEGKLVATVIINGTSQLHQKNGLIDYVDFCNTHPHQCPNLQGYMPLDKAKRLLKRTSDKNNMDLGYIVVIPKAQGRGVGTRVISSIVHNPKFFSNNHSPISIDAIVHKNNIASHKAFIRNGFGEYSLNYQRGLSRFHEIAREL